MKEKGLYVVTAIDAEGPIDDPRKPDILNSWDRVDGLLDRLFARDFREVVRDTGGNGTVISWHNDPDRCPDDLLSMLGSHSFEVLRYLLGKPASVYSINQCLQSLSETADSSVSLLRMKNGATAIFTHLYIVPSLGYLRVEGTEGTATYEIDSNEVILRTGRDTNSVPAPTERDALAPLDDRFEQVVEFAKAIHRQWRGGDRFCHGLSCGRIYRKGHGADPYR